MSFQSFCSKCGGQLIQQDENTFKCKFCDSIYREDTLKKEIDALSLLLDEKKREEISNLKRELWKKANEEFLDSKEILRLCQEVKKLVPDDFYANFYEAANSDNEDRLVSMLECMDVIEHYDDIEDVIEYCLKSITPKNMLAICNLIEKAFKQNDLSKYNEYRTRYDEKCVLINDCVYDPAYPRDVFVCYSSKDMPKVEELVKFLEEQGLLCFVAMRNLQHGRGAVQNYWNALHTAIESCKCVVFLSSTNSRDMHCDALQELRYVLSLEQKLNKKIKRIEYLLENYTGAVVERNFKRIFEGLEYCYDVDTVYDRIMWDDDEVAVPEVQSPEISVQKEIKYCVNCGKENLDSAKFCSDCGKDVFVATHEEYVEQLKKQREELEALRQSLASANQQVEEQKRIAEEQKSR
ncbi:MAG: TIR domain-containing protein [Clostridia bacterium]|nr:TIR domain-containing protein [Clostridia bacterium]